MEMTKQINTINNTTTNVESNNDSFELEFGLILFGVVDPFVLLYLLLVIVLCRTEEPVGTVAFAVLISLVSSSQMKK